MQEQRTEHTEDRVMAQISTLTPAEERVLEQAVRGLSIKEIADALVLTEATIKSHLAHIYAKLGVRGRVDLLARLGTPGGSNTRSIDRVAERGASSAEPPQRPDRAWLAYGSLPAALAGLALVVLLGAWLAGLAGPRPISVDDLDRLVAAKAVAELDLVGSLLEVTTHDGALYEVSGVDVEQVRPVAAEHEIPFSHSSPSSAPLEMWQVALNATPYVLIIVLLWVGLVAVVRTRPWSRSTR